MRKILFAACVLALCANAEATQIIGNSVTGPYQQGTNVGPKSVGFLTGSSALLLEDIQVVLGGQTGGGGTVTFTLNSDAAGLPGGVIATIGSGTVVGFAAPSAFTITPASPLSLAANNMYWIQAQFPTSPTGGLGGWERTDPQLAPSSGLATFVRYINSSGANSGVFNAIIVDGSIAAVPEPSAALLLGAGLTLLLGARFRAARRRS